MVLERSGMQVVAAVPLEESLFNQIGQNNIDAVLVDLNVESGQDLFNLANLLDRLQRECRLPVLFNDSSASMSDATVKDLGRKLYSKLTSLTSPRG